MTPVYIVYYIHRYGGWYTDLDTVTIAPTDQLQRAVGFFKSLENYFDDFVKIGVGLRLATF